MCFNPVPELDNLRSGHLTWDDLHLDQASERLNAITEELLDLHLSLHLSGAAALELVIGDKKLVYEPISGEVSLAGSAGRLMDAPKELTLRILVDRGVVEVFVQDGEAAFASTTIFKPGKPRFGLQGEGLVKNMTVHMLKSIWA